MSWSEEQIEAVWKKALTIPGVDKDQWRTDYCGAWIARNQYGKISTYGWEIDHVFPESKGLNRGYTQEQVDNIENLRPMHWENNRSKGDDYPVYTSALTRKDNINVEYKASYTVNETLQESLNVRFKRKLVSH